MYEILVAVLIFLAVRRLRLRRKMVGFVFISWTALAAASRLFLEAFRGDSLIVLGSLRAAQLASLAILLTAMFGLNPRARNERRSVKGSA